MAADFTIIPPSNRDYNVPALLGNRTDPPPSFLKRVGQLMLGPRSLEPRKGGNPSSISPIGQALRAPGNQAQAVIQQRDQRLTTPGYSLLNLANRDDIIFSIRRTLRTAIGDLKWKISPKLDKIKADIKRWNIVTQVNESYPEWGLKFVPEVIDPQFFYRAQGSLNNLILEERTADPDKGLTHSSRLRQFFQNVLAYHEAIAESHILTVQDAFESPNPSAESSFRSLLNQIVDELTLNDACALIKNPRVNGRWGEMYTIPGGDVRIYRKEDRATPQPPLIAYDWYENGAIKAFYNNLEMVYMMANQQPDGYGLPPIQTIIEQMIGSIYGDNYLVDFFQNNNMPFGIFDLGPNVTQAERDAVDEQWDARVRTGIRRIIFVGNKDGVKGFMPMPQGTNRDMEVMEAIKFWAHRKCAVFGLSLNDIGFTDDLKRESGMDAQNDITQSRGVNSLAKLVAGYLNSEIVEGWHWVREDAEKPNDLDGKAFPCFTYVNDRGLTLPIRDVEFTFLSDEDEQKLEDAQRAVQMVDTGIMSRNEVRAELGEPPIEGGDIYFITAMKTRVSDLETLPAGGEQQEGEGGEQGGETGEDGDDSADGGSKPVKAPQPPKPKVNEPGEGGDGDGAEKRLRVFADEIGEMISKRD